MEVIKRRIGSTLWKCTPHYESQRPIARTVMAALSDPAPDPFTAMMGTSSPQPSYLSKKEVWWRPTSTN